MKQMFLLSAVILSGVLAVASQTRTITNADLEKYRQERLKAEREYRENYERLGMPSPEELDRRREEDAKALSDLASRLRYEREVREYAQAQQSAASGATIIVPQQYYINDGYYRRRVIGYVPYYHNYQGERQPRGNYQDWRATPGGIIYEPGGRSSHIWTPRTTRPAPAFRQSRRR